MNGTDALLTLSMLALSLAILFDAPPRASARRSGAAVTPSRVRVALDALIDPPRPQRVPEHVIEGRRAQLERNRGRWGL